MENPTDFGIFTDEFMIDEIALLDHSCYVHNHQKTKKPHEQIGIWIKKYFG